jgi:DNA-binding beta-propeller fold protein YncE
MEVHRALNRSAPAIAMTRFPLLFAGLFAAMLSPLTLAVVDAQVPGLSGTLVITNKAPSTATIVDVGSAKILATLPTGNGPHEVALSRNGQVAVVTDYGTGPAPGSSLTVIDVPGLRVLRTISVAPYQRPHGIVFLPGDSMVAVTAEASQAVVTVHLERGEVVRVANTGKQGSHMVGVTADGGIGWTGDMGSNTVTELDMASGRAVRSIDVPERPEAINVTADGSDIWVGSNATGKISVIDGYTGAVTTAAEGFQWPYRVLFSPDAETVMIPDYRAEVLRFFARRARRELGSITFEGGGPQGITVTPDGQYVLLSLSREGRIAVIRLADRTVAGYLPAGDTPDGVVYSTLVVPR